MAITQIIAPLSAVLNDSETFYEDIAIRNNSLVTVSFPSINAWATQANTTQAEINAKALQVAAQAVDGGYSQDYINSNFFSQTYINTNFVGVNNAQNITKVKTFTVSPIVPTPTTDYQAATKKYVDDNNKINTLTNKTTPVDADEMVISDSALSFSLKKLSFTNLKATLLTYFDTLYSRTSTIFGIGQTWQNVTASRSAGVTYTNSTGKSITVSLTTFSGSAEGRSFSVNGSIVNSGYSGTYAAYTCTAIVPNLATYILNSSSNATLWTELR